MLNANQLELLAVDSQCGRSSISVQGLPSKNRGPARKKPPNHCEAIKPYKPINLNNRNCAP